MSSFWNWWVIGITVANILACFWRLPYAQKQTARKAIIASMVEIPRSSLMYSMTSPRGLE